MEIQRWKTSAGSSVKDFRELKVWQKAHQLTLAVYQLTASFPREELYGLSSQLRRAGSSIAATWRKDAGVTEMRNWPGSAPWPWARRANSNIPYFRQRPEAHRVEGLSDAA
jgi:23S rRNA-intervening sequence protein